MISESAPDDFEVKKSKTRKQKKGKINAGKGETDDVATEEPEPVMVKKDKRNKPKKNADSADDEKEVVGTDAKRKSTGNNETGEIPDVSELAGGERSKNGKRKRQKKVENKDTEDSNKTTSNEEASSSVPEEAEPLKKGRKKKPKMTAAFTVDRTGDRDLLESSSNGKLEHSEPGANESVSNTEQNKRKKMEDATDSTEKETQSKRLKKKTSDETGDAVNNAEDEDEKGTDKTKKEKKPSKRQLKKEKAEVREAELRAASKKDATQKALTYVSKWKHAKSEWKFEKLRQIWLMDHVLDESLVPDTIFPIVLEYFEGSKGMARHQLVKKGMNVIQKLEAQEDEEERDQIMQTVEYQRARQLLQALPTET